MVNSNKLIIYTQDIFSKRVGEVTLFTTECDFIYTVRFYDNTHIDSFLAGTEPDVINRKDNVLLYFSKVPEFLESMFNEGLKSFSYLDCFIFSPLCESLV